MPPESTDFITRMLERATPLPAEDFKGVTTDGNIVPGLFSLAKTSASTERIKIAVDAFLGSLAPEQRSTCEFPLGSKAILGTALPPDVFASAYRNNFEMKYEGIKFDDLSSSQQALTMNLARTYIGRIRPEYAEVKMEEVKKHLKDTHIAWIGGTTDDDVFYHRVHRHVVLIEFDHNRGIAFDNDKPSQNHVHSVVRKPNGNDYGKDLLRQHREQATHADR